MYANLGEYIRLLEKEGELVRIGAFVDPVEEMAETADRMAKSPGGGKALLFENTGTRFAVAINLFGSDRRMALALGERSLDGITQRIERLISAAASPKGSLMEKINALPLVANAAKWFPKRSGSRGECQQVIFTGKEAHLDMLPILKCWPADGGRFVTLPIVNTIHPTTGVSNAGMYRMQVMGDHSTGMHWHIHKTGAKHYEAYRRAGRRMPVSVCLGGDPAYTYAATAPVPDGIDEYLLAGFLRGKPVRLVKSVTNDIYVPSDCDFVIEGYVDPLQEKVTEGPFGDHTGFYSLEDLYPIFHVTAITHRREAIYPATVVGIPPQEDHYIAKATERIFLAPLRMVMQPELEDLYMPSAGVTHNLAIISLEVRYPGHARQAAASLWGAGQMMFNKFLLIAPAGTDIRDRAAMSALIRNMEPGKAVIAGQGVLDVLDHAAATTGCGGKLALDLTDDRAGEIPPLDIPADMVPEGGFSAWNTDHYAQWGVVVLYAEPGADVDASRFVARNCPQAKIAAIFDPCAEQMNAEELLWLGTGNADASRDVTVCDGTLVIDARTKLPGRADYPARFPNVVASSEQIINTVDSRWEEYGIGKFIESPSKRYRKLLHSDTARIGQTHCSEKE